MMETFWCVSGWLGGCCLPRACGRVVWLWEMGGLGSAEARMPGFSRYDAGMGGGGGWKQKQEAEGTALWKCDEQKNVYVITLVGPKMD